MRMGPRCRWLAGPGWEPAGGKGQNAGGSGLGGGLDRRWGHPGGATNAGRALCGRETYLNVLQRPVASHLLRAPPSGG